MLKCHDSTYVLKEIEKYKKTFFTYYVCILGFDNVNHVQISRFLAAKPTKPFAKTTYV
uniref:Ribulose bisphosphate carboxylase small subunit domain-containing protein n=1 Tax=Physcomitrium patens TaxID=3218 RepID=A0A2K1J8C6_PHYPA|nr:hypothetical protein PHYPA_020891 [Physcomitrium patens]